LLAQIRHRDAIMACGRQGIHVTEQTPAGSGDLSPAESVSAYDQVDTSNMQRIGAILWLVLVGLICAVLPITPPTEELGDAGWLLAAVVVAIGLGFVALMRSERLEMTWDAQLAAAYIGVLGLALLQWSAGGIEAPYEPMVLLLVLYVAAIHPPRRTAVFMAFVAAAVIAPLIYGSPNDEDIAEALINLVTWGGLAFVASRLMRAVRSRRLQLQHTAETAQIEARLDSLTGLPNRRAFDESLDTEIRRAARLEIPLSVLMLDIANFKRVNDIWGTAKGDECLRAVANALREEVRKPDILFRWGGDEFALVLSGADQEGAREAGRRLKDALAATVRGPDGDPIRIRFGSAELEDETQPGDLVERVGLSLAAAKTELTTEDAAELFRRAREEKATEP
jgi:diguanylate cyclase (GGDEF)-like protein